MSISRRDFLRGAATAGAASLCVPKALASVVPGSNANVLGVLVDLSLCSGCRTCEAACYEENKDRDTNRKTNNAHEGNLPPPPASFEDRSVTASKRRPSSQTYTVVNRYQATDPAGKELDVYRKIQCFHCNEPACASACLVGAISKTKEGAVVYNADICIGCRYCMAACPFNIPAYEYEKAFTPRVLKCTFCSHRTSAGRPPACVEACPYGVMTFGKRSELLELANERIAGHPERYVHHIYGEREVGGTSWLYLSPAPFEKLGFQANLPQFPIPELTMSALSVVPMVILLWPAVLGGLYMVNTRKEKIAAQEKQSAVETAIEAAVGEAEARGETKLAGALKKAEKEKEQAVKKALEEAKKTAAEQEAK
jgi:Fe-S-cluster-containing dehydrogenase component